MRILAFSDLHGEEAALEALKALTPQFDKVFICGDVSRTQSFAKEVLDSFPDALVIPGNWDSELMHETFSASGNWLHERRVELDGGLNAVGFGLSNITPFGTYGEITEDEIYERMSRLPIDGDTILMLHCPPKGHFDLTGRGTHAGSSSILRIIEEKRPLAALFGHVHEHSGSEKLDSTTLVKLPAANAMRACALTVKDKRVAAEFLRL